MRRWRAARLARLAEGPEARPVESALALLIVASVLPYPEHEEMLRPSSPGARGGPSLPRNVALDVACWLA